MRKSIRVLSLPGSDGRCWDFPMDKCKINLMLNPDPNADSYLIVFNADGREIYRVYNDSRDWASILVNVGKYLCDAAQDK